MKRLLLLSLLVVFAVPAQAHAAAPCRDKIFNDWYADGKIRFLFQYGSEPHPDLKDVPLALDLLQSPADKTLLTAAAVTNGTGRLI